MPVKRHYADKAAVKFLRGTVHTSPDEAIAAGARTEEQWSAFMKGEAARFWSENGQKARRAVRKRHKVKTQKTRLNVSQRLKYLPQSEEIGQKRPNTDVLALEKRASEWANIGGIGRAGIEKSARAAYALYLDFARHAVAGDFPGWLAARSGAHPETCRRRFKAGSALALGVNPRWNQSGLLAELRERETNGAV
ncbi:hypothetical protein GCM10022631_11990 [Deinococcus rubellus]|uniref:Uncharacterized protein n=1 Tax=Deinococcus rubellus TaxID=1889240 RepID=A0ABY5YD37_9DEIO|nr:hypothetical protein [Deinococcus rubellus]UWX62755.1 hypothetical protein N0D28_08210 [Deinococcus rubellus]